MIYYALGGGLGHLVRARSFLHTLGIDSAVVLTASEFARDARVVNGLRVSAVPRTLEQDRRALRSWLHEEIVRLAADCLCIDSFPAGILGELSDLDLPMGVELWHVARLLRWGAYEKLLSGVLPRFDRCFCVEAPSAEQHDFLRRTCAQIEDLELREAKDAEQAHAPWQHGSLGDASGYWLVVHSGPEEEVRELVAFAHALRAAEGSSAPVYAASLQLPTDLPAGTFALDAFPARAYFAGAERIVTAAGFNVMRETLPYRHKQAVLPMPRRFDDQFERARRARALGTRG